MRTYIGRWYHASPNRLGNPGNWRRSTSPDVAIHASSEDDAINQAIALFPGLRLKQVGCEPTIADEWTRLELRLALSPVN